MSMGKAGFGAGFAVFPKINTKVIFSFTFLITECKEKKEVMVRK